MQLSTYIVRGVNRNQAKPLAWRLVQRRHWWRLRTFLNSAEGKNQVLSSLVSLDSDMGEKKENILHMACRKRAPLYILERLCEIQAMLAVETNAQGQTALHIAVAAQASSSVVEYLLQTNPAATFVRDDDSRTPLHLACMGAMSGEYYDDPMLWIAYSPDFATVRLLCDANPHMANEEDAEGMTPIEHALVSNAHASIVHYLRHVSAAAMKQEQKKQRLQNLRQKQEVIKQNAESQLSEIAGENSELEKRLDDVASKSETKLNDESKLSECTDKSIALEDHLDDLSSNLGVSATQRQRETKPYDTVQRNTESKLSECTGKDMALEKRYEVIISSLRSSSASQGQSGTKLSELIRQNAESDLSKISGEVRLDSIASAIRRASSSQRQSAPKLVSSVSRAA